MATDWAKRDWYLLHHSRRFKHRIEVLGDAQSCPACKGAGGEVEPILDDGSGPFLTCGLCEGHGDTTHWLAMMWLRMLKVAKRERIQARREAHDE